MKEKICPSLNLNPSQLDSIVLPSDTSAPPPSSHPVAAGIISSPSLSSERASSSHGSVLGGATAPFSPMFTAVEGSQGASAFSPLHEIMHGGLSGINCSSGTAAQFTSPNHYGISTCSISSLLSFKSPSLICHPSPYMHRSTCRFPLPMHFPPLPHKQPSLSAPPIIIPTLPSLSHCALPLPPTLTDGAQPIALSDGAPPTFPSDGAPPPSDNLLPFSILAAATKPLSVCRPHLICLAHPPCATSSPGPPVLSLPARFGVMTPEDLDIYSNETLSPIISLDSPSPTPLLLSPPSCPSPPHPDLTSMLHSPPRITLDITNSQVSPVNTLPPYLQPSNSKRPAPPLECSSPTKRARLLEGVPMLPDLNQPFLTELTDQEFIQLETGEIRLVDDDTIQWALTESW